uniref:Uncharacterized protein n=1 Tax=Onchocerca volvulus TaxID=6282 RepID=A0A8R1TIH6_ONCVO
MDERLVDESEIENELLLLVEMKRILTDNFYKLLRESINFELNWQIMHKKFEKMKRNRKRISQMLARMEE